MAEKLVKNGRLLSVSRLFGMSYGSTCCSSKIFVTGVSVTFATVVANMSLVYLFGTTILCKFPIVVQSSGSRMSIETKFKGSYLRAPGAAFSFKTTSEFMRSSCMLLRFCKCHVVYAPGKI